MRMAIGGKREARVRIIERKESLLLFLSLRREARNKTIAIFANS
jgi:hypothetical protein